MKKQLLLVGVLFMLSVCITASAKNSPYKHLSEVANWSHSTNPLSLNNLPYKNILDAARWSGLPTGRVLAAQLKKHAHSPQGTAGDLILMEDNSGAGCGWSCCFKSCMSSALGDAGNGCLVNCTGCGLTGAPWACAICVGCGAVAIAALEFCGLHCCVNPGC